MWIVKKNGVTCEHADVDNLLVKTEKKLKLWSMDINIRWGRVFGRDPRRRGSMYERGTPWPAQG